MEQSRKNRQKNAYLWALLSMTVLYVIQFFVLPPLFPGFFPSTNEASLLFWLSACGVLILGVGLGVRRLMPWLAADLGYFGLVLLYCAEGAYGIGSWFLISYRPDAVPLGAAIALAEILAIQLSLLAALRIAGCLRRKKARDSSS